MTTAAVRKVFLGAEGYFGPTSGLGALEYGTHGACRPILSSLITLPLGLPAPSLWELHLVAAQDLPVLRLFAKGGPDAPLPFALRAGIRIEIPGLWPADAGPDPALTLRLDPAPLPGCLLFLGLSVLPLPDLASRPAA